jgi:hypothetical protein
MLVFKFCSFINHFNNYFNHLLIILLIIYLFFLIIEKECLNEEMNLKQYFYLNGRHLDDDWSEGLVRKKDMKIFWLARSTIQKIQEHSTTLFWSKLGDAWCDSHNEGNDELYSIESRVKDIVSFRDKQMCCRFINMHKAN